MWPGAPRGDRSWSAIISRGFVVEILALSYLFVHLGEMERKAFMTN